MELVINESSKKECVNSIILHIQNQITALYCKLQVMIKYDICRPILLLLFPSVLHDIIIEYVNESLEIDIFLKQSFSDAQLYVIHVTCTELNINHTYQLTYIYPKICISYLTIYQISYTEMHRHEKVTGSHNCFVNYYMKQYHPKKEQLTFEQCVNKINHNCDDKSHIEYIINNITNKEIFDNELVVIIALINSLYNFNVS